MNQAEVSWDLAWSYFVQQIKKDQRRKSDTWHVRKSKYSKAARHSTAQHRKYRTARQGTAGHGTARRCALLSWDLV